MEKRMVSYPYPNQNIVSSILDDVLRSVSAASIPVNRPTAMTAVHQPAQVIFNPPATIVYWRDGTKTVVRCDNDEFSEEFGFAMACMRKIFGTRNAFKAQFKNAYRPYLKKKKEKHTDSCEVKHPDAPTINFSLSNNFPSSTASKIVSAVTAKFNVYFLPTGIGSLDARLEISDNDKLFPLNCSLRCA